MSTLQKLKAYFGMVPADEFDDYESEDYDRRGGYRRPEYLDEEFDDYPPGRRRWLGAQREYGDDFDAERPARPSWAQPEPATHGALAVEPRREPAPRLRPVETAPAPGGYPLGRVITLHPTSYNEARTIGEHYRDGRPVIMNLTEMDDADAKRLVDFAAGLAFALRGSIDKVTAKVFLISPPNIDPTAEDKRRLVEGGFDRRG
ncbi:MULTISPECIES: cell division protein SepF [Actinokineospora]|uniref:Cell division protein SepF n=1 Tax=Actinokineospora fastidiosa TaxID=1816 RepID=A0A918LF06_9PSEU|nr:MULTISPECIES: cell division protein SepF [Actinokineospora]UVS80937.1 Cell division protein SepF [Actinokineospora sp. UTMC 2448]GGS38348.1 cell division protein SepF [Actinokineospora fastidiosa]